MKTIDPIKDLSARDLADKLIMDLDDMAAEYKAQLKASVDAGELDNIGKLCDELEKYKFASEFIKEYIEPIPVSLKDTYNSLKTKEKKQKFIAKDLTYLDPFELLASGVLAKDSEGNLVHITISNGDGYIDWIIAEVGSDYVKIQTANPVPNGNGKVVLPTAIIGEGMSEEEVRESIDYALKKSGAKLS